MAKKSDKKVVEKPKKKETKPKEIKQIKVQSNEAEGEGLVALVIDGMQDKKAEDITVIDISKLPTGMADYFVVCTVNSDTQADAVAKSVEDIVYKKGNLKVKHIEGKVQKEWMLLDYYDVVVHIFRRDKRAFYGLEEHWGDAKFTHVEDISNPFLKKIIEKSETLSTKKTVKKTVKKVTPKATDNVVKKTTKSTVKKTVKKVAKSAVKKTTKKVVKKSTKK